MAGAQQLLVILAASTALGLAVQAPIKDFSTTSSTCLASEPLQWGPTLQRALDQQRLRQYAEAAALLTQLIADAECRQSGDARIGIALYNLGAVYHEAGRYRDAEKAYLRSIAILEDALGPRHPMLARTGLYNLASLYIETGDLAKAKALLERTALIAAGGVEDRHGRARLLSNLASVAALRGHNSDATILLEQALAMYTEGPDATDENAGVLLNNLAVLAAKRNDCPAAMHYADRAVTTLRGREAEEPAQLVRVLVNHALLEAKCGAIRMAELEAEEALGLAERWFGATHRVTGTALSGYATVLHAGDHDGEAEELEDRARAIRARSDREDALGMTIDAEVLMGASEQERD